jgi:hypothetical protein
MARFGDFDQYLDNAGDPLVEGKLYFYESGTTTPKTTYSDVNNSIPNTNPVLLSAAGRQPNIFFDGVAKVILTDNDDVQLIVRDPVGETATDFGDQWVSTKIYNATDVVLGSDGTYYRSLINGNQNNNPVTTTGNWTLLYSVEWNAGITYQVGAVVTYDGEQYQSLQGSNLNQNPSTASSYWVLLSFAWLATATYAEDQNAVGTDGILYTSLQNGNIGNDPATSPAYWVGTSAAAAASAVAAAASAAAALVSENAAAADAIATAADVVQTGLDAAATAADAIATAADRVQTGLDAAATAADVILTNADAVATAADRVQTGLDAAATSADAIATAADRVQTGLDVIATNADASSTAADAIATAADVVQTGLDVVATSADVVQTGLDVTAAAGSASAASGSASAAAGSAAAAAASYDAFDDRYLGDKASDPTLDNDGNALLTGALYFNTTSDVMKVYDGSAWNIAAISSASPTFTGTVTADGLTLNSGSTSNLVFNRVSSASPYGGISIQSNLSGTTYYSGEINHFNGDWRIKTQPTSSTDSGLVRMIVGSGGDISFYEDTGTTPKFFWDASEERLGLGTVSPARTLHLAANTNCEIRLEAVGQRHYAIASNSSNAFVVNDVTAGAERLRIDSSGNVGIGTSPTAFGGGFIVSETSGSSGGYSLQSSGAVVTQIAADSTASVGYTGTRSNHPYVFTTNNAERMRIDSSGNLLVGKTSSSFSIAGHSLLSTGYAAHTRSGGNPLTLNRLTSDGSILAFEKDGTTVGSIGSNTSGTRLHIGKDNVALSFAAGGANAIIPWDSTANAVEDAALNLGGSTARFKDLYLSGDIVINDQTNGATRKILFDMRNTGGAQSDFSLQANNGNFLFYSEAAATERARIDSSGNLLVGTTSTDLVANNGIVATAAGYLDVGRDALVARFTRRSTDGSIVEFRKDGTTVGSIGAKTGSLYIGTDDAGIIFNHHGGGDLDAIFPYDVGTNTAYNGHVDIGGPSNRFKNVYLSGGVYLGGTVAANKLDDYEEGTWTPVFTSLTIGNGTQSHIYTKVGNKVTLEGTITLGSTSSISGALNNASVPFTANTTHRAYNKCYFLDAGTANYVGTAAVTETSNFQILADGAASTYLNYASLSSTVPFTWTSTDVIRYSITYIAA